MSNRRLMHTFRIEFFYSNYYLPPPPLSVSKSGTLTTDVYLVTRMGRWISHDRHGTRASTILAKVSRGIRVATLAGRRARTRDANLLCPPPVPANLFFHFSLLFFRIALDRTHPFVSLARSNDPLSSLFFDIGNSISFLYALLRRRRD